MNTVPRPLLAALAAAAVLVGRCLAAPPRLDDRVHDVEIRLDPTDRARLRAEPRRAVPARLAIDGQAVPGATVHLKGSRGSFAPIDGKPSLTFRLDDAPAAAFGLDRLLLNNAAEDPGLLHEVTGLEVFRRAGLDAPAAGHARLRLDGRDLGIVVLREGYGPGYRGRHFGVPGPVFEPDEGADLDGPADRHGRGDGPDRVALAAALASPDPVAAWAALTNLVDAGRLASFAAAEVFAGHRDGYAMARNNYRYCLDPATRRVVLLPHGMDRLFDDVSLPWRPNAAGGAVRAMLATDAGAGAHAARLRAMLADAADGRSLDAFVDSANARVLAATPAAGRAAQATAAADLKRRIHAHLADLARQLADPGPRAPDWRGDVAALDGWVPWGVPGDGALERGTNAAGRAEYRIRAGRATAASWRATVLLGRGRYRFAGTVRAEGVQQLPFGHAHGAALRRIGDDARSATVAGTAVPTDLALEFAVGEPTQVTLAFELRASAGTAAAEAPSLRLERLPGGP